MRAVSITWQNQENYKELVKNRNCLIPFIGAGFSAPSCPTWWQFLEQFRREITDDFLLPDDIENLKLLAETGTAEEYADLLVNRSGRGKAIRILEKSFTIDKPLRSMKAKFEALHSAFDGLIITTNFDSLLEITAPSPLHKIHGNNPKELDDSFTLDSKRTLLKIHGGIDNPSSIILTKIQYDEIYGNNKVDIDLPIPQFLRRVFKNRSLLFIGCSLCDDRTMDILKEVSVVKPHFALMKYEPVKESRVELNRRLSNFQIHPIWFNDFDEITEILQSLISPSIANSGIEVFHQIEAIIIILKSRIDLIIKLIKLSPFSDEVQRKVKAIDNEIKKIGERCGSGDVISRINRYRKIKELINEGYNIKCQSLINRDREIEYLETKARNEFESFLNSDHRIPQLNLQVDNLSYHTTERIKELNSSLIQLAEIKSVISSTNEMDLSKIENEIDFLKKKTEQGNARDQLSTIFNLSYMIFLRYRAQKFEMNRRLLVETQEKRDKQLGEIDFYIKELEEYKIKKEKYDRMKNSADQLRAFIDEVSNFDS